MAAALAMAAAPARAQPNPEPSAALAKLFPDAGKPGIPGCTMDVRKDSRVLHSLTYGMANLELPTPITKDTIFEAGSVSKQFVGAAIAQLSSSGRLSLEDDVRKFVPEMLDYGAVITIRNLLNHTSGIRDWHDLTEIQGWGEGASAYTQDFAVDLIARQRGLNFAPGSEYSYSNSNFILAAAIVARVSGKTLDEFSQEAFFRPLGMTKTSWRKDFRDVVPGRAQGYAEDGGAWKLDMPFESTMGGGGLLTTVSDMQAWNAFLSAPPARDAPWVASMTQPGRLANGRALRYGLGIELQTVQGLDAFTHAGWTAGYKAYLGRIPSLNLSAAILCNTSAINTEEVGPQYLALFAAAGAPDPAPAAVALPGTDEALSARVVGRYRVATTGAVVEVTASEGGISFGGGAVFHGGAGGRYRNASGTREATVVLSRNGDVATILLTRTNNSDLQLIPITPWAPDAAALQAFAGTYSNRETQARLSVRPEGGALVVTGENALRWEVKPVYLDTFEGDDYRSWRLAFLRTAAGKVDAMTLTRARTRALRFERLP